MTPSTTRMALIEPAYRKLTRRLGRRPSPIELARAESWTPAWVKVGIAELIEAGRLDDLDFGFGARVPRTPPAAIAQAAPAPMREAARAKVERKAAAPRKTRRTPSRALKTKPSIPKPQPEAFQFGGLDKYDKRGKLGAKFNPRPDAPTHAVPPSPKSSYARHARRHHREWTIEDRRVYADWIGGIDPETRGLLFEDRPSPLLAGGRIGGEPGHEDEE